VKELGKGKKGTQILSQDWRVHHFLARSLDPELEKRGKKKEKLGDGGEGKKTQRRGRDPRGVNLTLRRRTDS